MDPHLRLVPPHLRPGPVRGEAPADRPPPRPAPDPAHLRWSGEALRRLFAGEVPPPAASEAAPGAGGG